MIIFIKDIIRMKCAFRNDDDDDSYFYYYYICICACKNRCISLVSLSALPPLSANAQYFVTHCCLWNQIKYIYIIIQFREFIVHLCRDNKPRWSMIAITDVFLSDDDLCMDCVCVRVCIFIKILFIYILFRALACKYLQEKKVYICVQNGHNDATFFWVNESISHRLGKWIQSESNVISITPSSFASILYWTDS